VPERLAQSAPVSITEDWRGAYRDFSRIGHGREGISLRLSQPDGLLGAYEELTALYEPLSADFLEFYPLLWQYAQPGSEFGKTLPISMVSV